MPIRIKNYSILGSTLGSPYFGKLPFLIGCREVENRTGSMENDMDAIVLSRMSARVQGYSLQN